MSCTQRCYRCLTVSAYDSVIAKPFNSVLTDQFSRYSEFDRLRENLVKAFPHAEGSIPKLPRKSVVSRFRPRFLEQRKNGLSHFIKYVLSILAE